MITREDLLWIAAIALLFTLFLRYLEVDTATIVIVVVVGSLVRLAYAWYARRTFRRR